MQGWVFLHQIWYKLMSHTNSILIASWNLRKCKQRKEHLCGCFCTYSITKLCLSVLVCVHVSRCCHTDVSQSAPLRAEACPSLGLLPRQEVCMLTHCVLAVLRRGIHPVTLQGGSVREKTFPMGEGRVNFTVTTASTELMLLCFLQPVAWTAPNSSIEEYNESFKQAAYNNTLDMMACKCL